MCLWGSSRASSGREAAGVDLLLDHGVVAGQAHQTSLAEQVRARVPDVRQVGLVAIDHQHDQRGAHAPGLGVGLARPANRDRSLVHRVAKALAEHVRGIFAVMFADQTGLFGVHGADERAVHRLARHGRSHLTRSVATHAIGDHEHAILGVEKHGVFVVLAHGPHIGAGIRFQRH